MTARGTSGISQRWGSRKLWLAMFWQGCNTALLVTGYLPVEAYITVTWLLLGGYFIGNVASKYTLAKVGDSAGQNV